jgi:hypothetical protein
MQNRAKTGVEFENSVQVDGWVKKTKSPRMKWSGKGSSVFDKIKSIDYDPTRFILDETVDINKYDIYHPETKRYREVKKYHMDSFNDWVLYSEPYFKMASKGLFKKAGLRKIYSYYFSKKNSVCAVEIGMLTCQKRFTYFYGLHIHPTIL